MDVILFHDYVTSSGFTSQSAIKYKINQWKLEFILCFTRKNKVVITFDDGGMCYNWKFLEKFKNKFQFIVFIPTSFIGTKGFLSSEEILELHQNGIIIGAHSHSHSPHLFTAGIADFLEDWGKSKNILEEIIDCEVTNCSIPFGAYQPEQINWLSGIGFSTIFTSDCIETKTNSIINGRLAIDNRFSYVECVLFLVFNIHYLKFRSFFYHKYLKK